MKYSQTYLVVLITIGVVGFGFAAGAPVMHKFAGGDPASATQVNENFQQLADRIADNPASVVYDYRDYQSAANSKTFATTGLGACGDTEVRTFTRTPNGDNTDIAMLRIRTSGGAICQELGFQYLATPTEYQMLSKTYYDGSGGLVVVSTDNYDDTITRLRADMRMGMAFGSESSVTNKSIGNPDIDAGGFIETSTIVGTEDVTVPAGSYTACLKIHTLRTSNTTGAFNRMSWLCPGVGEVKRTQHEISTLAFRKWVLTNIN